MTLNAALSLSHTNSNYTSDDAQRRFIIIWSTSNYTSDDA